MNLGFLIGTDIISIIALSFTIVLSTQNNIISDIKNRNYARASLLTIIILVLEILDSYLQYSSGQLVVQFHLIVNVLGFSLTPLVPFLLFNTYYNINKYLNFCIVAPIFINIILCVTSAFNGAIFYINSANVYTRGPLFFVPIFIGIVYFIILLYQIKKDTKDFGKNEMLFLLSLFLLVAFSCTVQIITKYFYMSWASISIALILYYMYLREMQFQYDSLTGVKNRFTFDNEMKRFKCNTNSAVIMFDLNNLKSVNDIEGHISGDEAIIISAEIIKDAFDGIGYTYRIGGDEFCVICTKVTKELIEEKLLNVTNALNEINQSRNIDLVLAYGYALLNNKNCKSINEAMLEADQAMYIHKTYLKNKA